jgi:hypothetical protein
MSSSAEEDEEGKEGGGDRVHVPGTDGDDSRARNDSPIERTVVRVIFF